MSVKSLEQGAEDGIRSPAFEVYEIATKATTLSAAREQMARTNIRLDCGTLIRGRDIEEYTPSFARGQETGLLPLHLAVVPGEFDADDNPTTQTGHSRVHFDPRKYHPDRLLRRPFFRQRDALRRSFRVVYGFLVRSGRRRLTKRASSGVWGNAVATMAPEWPTFDLSVLHVVSKVTLPGGGRRFNIPVHPGRAGLPRAKKLRPSVYFTFVGHAKEVADLEEAELQAVNDCIAGFDEAEDDDVLRFGRFLALFLQGGFKYMVDQDWHGASISHLLPSGHRVMHAGPTRDAPNMDPITTGGGVLLPADVLQRSMFRKVTIDGIRRKGHPVFPDGGFDMYSMLPPGTIHVLIRRRAGKGAPEAFWMLFAPHGCFVYRGRSPGVQVAFPFGVQAADQRRLMLSRKAAAAEKAAVAAGEEVRHGNAGAVLLG